MSRTPPSMPTDAALRPSQAQVLAYEGGPLAISAVPGAGKTYVLTRLVSTLVTERGVAPSQILVLTAMRAAAHHFRHVVTGALAAQGASSEGLTVTTMHAFCLGLLARTGEGKDPITLSEAERAAILHEALDRYLEDPERRAHYERLNPPGASRWDDPRAQSVAAAMQVVAASRQYRLEGEAVARALAGLPYPELPFMLGYYEDALASRGALDFDAQIRQALGLLEGDAALRAQLRDRYRYVLEDEAQDSTPAQNRLLELLAGEGGNLVRVGDPNQAITGTFTFTDPRYFRAFCAHAARRGTHVAMHESSRSGRPILAIANALVALAHVHPDAAIRQAFEPVAIAEATAGPANPPASECDVQAFATATVQQERLAVIQQVRAHLRAHPQDRVAILVATNAQVRAYECWLAEVEGADGAVHVLTLHRAKGQEFEAVWIPGLGPSRVGRGQPVFPFPWLPEEVHLFGHKALLAQSALRPASAPIDPEAALEAARREAVSERLRLLYVGITRARRHLTLSCHTHDGKVAPPAHLQRLFAHIHAGLAPG